MPGGSKNSLFVGDLAIYCSELDLERVFAPYGNITEVKIMRSEETSRNLSYGFVKFSTMESAQNAMVSLDGVLLCGRPMRVRWAAVKSRLDPKDMKSEGLETSPVHVSFISYQIRTLVTEQSLRILFNKFGDVVDVSIKKSMIDKDIDRQSGYGFVHYGITQEGVESAISAVKNLEDTTIDEVNYKSSLAHSLNRFLSEDVPSSPEYNHSPSSSVARQQNASNTMAGMGGTVFMMPATQYSNSHHTPAPPQCASYQTVPQTYYAYSPKPSPYPNYAPQPVYNGNNATGYPGYIANNNMYMYSQESAPLLRSPSQSLPPPISQQVSSPSLSFPVQQMLPVMPPQGMSMMPGGNVQSIYPVSHSHVMPQNTICGPDGLAYNLSALTMSPMSMMQDNGSGITMIASPQMGYSHHQPYGVGYFNSPILVVPSPRSTDIRDDQLPYMNVNHLLQSPNTTNGGQYYVASSSPILPYGTVHPFMSTDNNTNNNNNNNNNHNNSMANSREGTGPGMANHKPNKNGSANCSPLSSHGSAPSTPSGNFNSDVVMVQAAVKNEKIAAKSSIRNLSNSYRKRLNPSEDNAATATADTKGAKPPSDNSVTRQAESPASTTKHDNGLVVN